MSVGVFVYLRVCKKGEECRQSVGNGPAWGADADSSASGIGDSSGELLREEGGLFSSTRLGCV